MNLKLWWLKFRYKNWMAKGFLERISPQTVVTIDAENSKLAYGGTQQEWRIVCGLTLNLKPH